MLVLRERLNARTLLNSAILFEGLPIMPATELCLMGRQMKSSQPKVPCYMHCIHISSVLYANLIDKTRLYDSWVSD